MGSLLLFSRQWTNLNAKPIVVVQLKDNLPSVKHPGRFYSENECVEMKEKAIQRKTFFLPFHPFLYCRL